MEELASLVNQNLYLLSSIVLGGCGSYIGVYSIYKSIQHVNELVQDLCNRDRSFDWYMDMQDRGMDAMQYSKLLDEEEKSGWVK